MRARSGLILAPHGAFSVERWPESGIPDNPGAWLMATAEHRAIDRLWRGQLLERKHDELGHELQPAELRIFGSGGRHRR